MPEPISNPAVLSTQNITGAPLVTLAAALLAAGQYLYFSGDKMPTDAAGWVSFGIGLLIAVGGALLRGPQKITSPAP